jgi:hypothetical protein
VRHSPRRWLHQRAAEQHVLGADVIGCLQSAGAGHDLHVRRDAADAIEEGLHGRVQIRVRHRALRARQQFGKGGGLVREREMGEAAFAQDFSDAQLVLRMRMTVEQRDGGGGDALGDAIERGSADGGFIEWFEHFASDADALWHLADDLVEDGPRLVFERKKIAAALVADAAGDRQSRA